MTLNTVDMRKKEYIFRLYITGRSAASRSAIINVEKIMGHFSDQQHILEVIDIAENLLRVFAYLE